MLYDILTRDTIPVEIINNPKSFVECLAEPSVIIALSAIVVSIVSLYFSVRFSRLTLEQTIKHNKLSVNPLLRFFVKNESKSNKIFIELHNCGFGPAIIKSFTLEYRDRIYGNFRDLIKENVDNLLDENSQSKIIKYIYYFDKDSFISSSDSITVFSVKSQSSEDLKHYKLVLKEIKAVVKYETIYGDKKELIEDNFWSKKDIT